VLLIAGVLGACGGGSTPTPTAPTYTIGGAVGGLAGTGLVLQDNGGDDLAIPSSGAFTFATRLASGAAYGVTVRTPPSNPSQTCTVTGGAGTVASANITGVTVTCTTNTYAVGGTVSGLAGTGLVLQVNGGDDLAVTSGAFTFAARVASGAGYAVTVKTQPSSPSQACTVTGGAGTVGGADVTGVTVTCITSAYTVGGTVSGLSGAGLVLQDNGGDDLPVSATGAFTFATRVASGAGYAVSVKAQPINPSQTCAVTGGAGTVGATDVTGVSVTCSTNTYSVGGGVFGLAGTGLVLQDNAGDDLAVSANGAFTFATRVASGGAYSVTVKTQPRVLDQVCLVKAAGGTVSAANVASVSVECAAYAPRFAYVANAFNNTVSIFTVEAATGQLRHGGYVSVGLNPSSVGVDPAGRFVYVTTTGASQVEAFSIDPATGALSAVAGSPFLPATGPTSVAVDPTGKFAYVANDLSNSISAFSINQGSGALTGAGTVTTGANPYSLTVDPTGRFVYVANNGATSVSAFTINPGNGALSAVAGSPFGAGAGPRSIAVDPTGRFAYVTQVNANTVWSYAIDQITGALAKVGEVATWNNPETVTVDPSGRFAYVANGGSSVVSAYTIDQTSGALTGVSGNPFPSGLNLRTVLVDPSGRFLYAASLNSNDVWTYAIDATTGALTVLPRVNGRNGPLSMAMTRGATAVTRTPKFAYVTNSDTTGGGNSVSAFSIDGKGSLAPVAGSPFSTSTGTAGNSPLSITADPSGRFVYTTNFQSPNNVSAFTINSGTGALAAIGGSPFASGGSGPISMAIDPSGRYAYVVNEFTPNVSSFTLGASSGVLTPVSTITPGSTPVSIATDPAGQYAFVANYGSSNVSAYFINKDNSGSLFDPNGVLYAAGINPRGITVDPTGKFVYTANEGSGTVSAWIINPTMGTLTPVPGSPFAAGAKPMSVAIDPSGRFAYVANNGSGTVSAFKVDPLSGALSAQTTAAAGGNPVSVTVDLSGRFVYVANQGTGDVSVFVIDPKSGALTSLGTAPAGTLPSSITTTGTIQ
jgi:6-phosphogluconolactonase (cycloisomerase 2 family)